MSNNSPAVQGFHIFTNEYLLLIFVRNGEERYILRPNRKEIEIANVSKSAYIFIVVIIAKTY